MKKVMEVIANKPFRLLSWKEPDIFFRKLSEILFFVIHQPCFDRNITIYGVYTLLKLLLCLTYAEYVIFYEGKFEMYVHYNWNLDKIIRLRFEIQEFKDNGYKALKMK